MALSFLETVMIGASTNTVRVTSDEKIRQLEKLVEQC